MTEEHCPKKILMCLHEPAIIEQRLKSAGFLVERTDLATGSAGDYIIGNSLVERKEIGDFFGSLQSGRLFDQLFKMKQCTEYRKYLVIIGNYPGRHIQTPKPILEKQIKGLGMVAYHSYDVLFIRVDTEEQFIDFIKWIWERCNTVSYAPLIKKMDDIKAVKVAMLGCNKGVGPQLANELAAHFTWKQLMDIEAEELAKYEFNGRKLGKRIEKLKEVLRL
jgi:ERCC4-type nuclease